MCNVCKEDVFFSNKINSNLNPHNIHQMPTSSQASRTGSGAGGGGGGGAGGGGMNPNTIRAWCFNPVRWWFVWMNLNITENTLGRLSFTPWRIIQPERWSKKSSSYSWWEKLTQPFPAKQFRKFQKIPDFHPRSCWNQITHMPPFTGGIWRAIPCHGRYGWNITLFQ